jgi:ligand-binding sensor domain-containing protein
VIKSFQIFFLVIFLHEKILAQFEPVRNFSVKDGLPSGVVYDCLQDKQGFMWFATAAGLARFDGVNFKVFTTEDGLTNNEILQIGLDEDGSIWIFPFGATACIYDPVTKKLYNESNYPELNKVKNLPLQMLVRNSQNRLIGCTVHETFFF